MADQSEEEDLKIALGMSMQSAQPEPKRSKPREVEVMTPEESRLRQREIMAAAAEKRMQATKIALPPASASSTSKVEKNGVVLRKEKEIRAKESNSGRLSEEEAEQLFSMLFGNFVSKDILAQWTNQGIRFSPDPETSMGLVQHEGGPCGVLATIQAFVLKYLLFFPSELGKTTPNIPQKSGVRRSSQNQCVASDIFASFTDDAKARALVKSMGEILFSCGSDKRAVIANLSAIDHEIQGSEGASKDVVITRSLEGLSFESAADLHKVLRVETHAAKATAFKRLAEMIPVFQNRMGVLLFLISALLSRGLDCVQADRDDPSLPLVTAPFGHASQEIVNLLLCGRAAANVFDGRMNLGGGMFLKGIPTNVEVGFLTLLEYLNFCKVGQNLKRPKWPIWVVGSESHYTVLFALDVTVQDENEMEERELHIRKAFDAQDLSGGGGFISVEGFEQVLRDTNARLPPEKLDSLSSSGFIVWSEFWQAILGLDKSLGGLKESSGLMGRKVFDLYHFNGIAKSVSNGSQSASPPGEIPIQRPRLTKLRVSVPPKSTPDKFMTNVLNGSSGKDAEGSEPESSQQAPLVDCIGTRWPHAVCNWVGDPPSIV